MDHRDNLGSASGHPKDPDLKYLLEFKSRRKMGERITAREMIESHRLVGDRELCIDLAFAEFLENSHRGDSTAEESIYKAFPEYTDELQRQIGFHKAMSCLEGESFGAEEQSSFESDGTAGQLPDAVAMDSALESHIVSIPGLQVLQELGRGGMGVVYLAHQPRLNRRVAVKLLLGGALASPVQRLRFRAEAQAAAALRHPNIVQIDEVGEAAGQPYLVMEYVRGGTLEQFQKRNPISCADAAELVRVLADAVHVAHQNGIVHRDLKPGNILLAPSTTTVTNLSSSEGANSSAPMALANFIPKITDFGLAKSLVQDDAIGPTLTVAGDLLGTPSFMAPEQASNGEIGPATDVYALGAMLYYLLEGKPPFLKTSAWDTLQSVVEDPPPRLSRLVPVDLRTICETCLAKSPNDRYSSASRLAIDLENFLQFKPIFAKRSGPLQYCWSWCRRNLAVSILSGIVFVTLSVLLIVSLWSRAQLVVLLDAAKQLKRNEEQAHSASLENLWDSMVSEASSYQATGKIGQRYKSLEKVRQAKQLFGKVVQTNERQSLLRNTALASLLLPDAQRVSLWTGAIREPIQYSADAKLRRFATIRSDRTLVVTDSVSKEIIKSMPDENVNGLSLSPNGRWLALWGASCRVLDLNREGPAEEIQLNSPLWIFSPDSSCLAGYDEKGLFVWNVMDRTQQRIDGIDSPVAPMAFSRDGKKLAVMSHQWIQIVNLETRSMTATIPAPTVSQLGEPLAWHPDGIHLASAVYKGNLLVMWNVVTGERIREFPIHGEFFRNHFDAKGQRLFAIGMWNGSRNVYDVESGEALLQLPPFCGVIFGQDSDASTLLLSDPLRGAPEYWRIEPQRLVQFIRTNGPAVQRYQTRSTNDGQWLIVHTERGLEIYDSRTGLSALTLPIGRMEFDAIEVDQNGGLWGLHAEGLLRWQFEGNVLRGPDRISTPDNYSPIAISSDGNWVCCTDGANVLLHSLKTTQQDRNTVLGQLSDVRNANFSPDGRWLAAGSWNDAQGVRVWEVATRRVIASLDVGRNCQVKFSPDSRWLYTSPNGGEIWNTSTWRRSIELGLAEQTESARAFDFSPDSRWCAFSPDPGIVRIVNLNSGSVIADLTDSSDFSYFGMSVSRDSRFIDCTTVGNAGRIQRWDLRDAESALIEIDLPALNLIPAREALDAVEPHDDAAGRVLLLQPTPLMESLVYSEAAKRAADAMANEFWSDAVHEWKRALELFPGNSQLLDRYAWSLVTVPLEYRDAGTALESVRKAMSLQDNQMYWGTYAAVLAEVGAFHEALECAHRDREDRGDRVAIASLFVMARCYAELDDLKSAEPLLKLAQTLLEEVKDSIPIGAKKELEHFHREAKQAFH